MVHTDLKQVQNILQLQKQVASVAKLNWNRSQLCQLSVFCIGVLAMTTNYWSLLISLASAIFAAASVFFNWRSAQFKQVSQYLLRVFEFWDGLGEKWSLSEQEMRDIETSVLLERLKHKRIPSVAIEEHPYYFFSRQDASPDRLAENLEESSWWSKQLAERASNVYLTLSLVILLLDIIMLLLILQLNASDQLTDIASRFVITSLLLVFSESFLRLSVNYRTFQRKATEIENKVNSLRRSGFTRETEILKLYHEYQITRADSPLLPTWLWKRKQDDLSKAWEKYH